MGFIGSVLGISQAVSALRGAFETSPPAAVAGDTETTGANSAPASSQSDWLKSAMGNVSAGLSSAFDTTFIALTIAILLLFPTETLRKTEYAMLDRIEKFANESLLRRMVERDVSAGLADSPALVKEALEPAFREHQRWLAQWQAQVAELGRVIGADFEAAATRIQERVAESERSRAESLRQLSSGWDRLFSQLQQASATWQKAGEQANTDLAAALTSAERMQTVLAQSLPRLTETVQQFQSASPSFGQFPAAVEELRAAAEALRQTSATIHQIDGVAGAGGFWSRWRARSLR